jgi:hypothetical protein
VSSQRLSQRAAAELGRKAGIWDQGGSYRATSTLACVEQSPAAIMLVSGAANYVEKESPGPTHA